MTNTKTLPTIVLLLRHEKLLSDTAVSKNMN